jgi:hypothetical protein
MLLLGGIISGLCSAANATALLGQVQARHASAKYWTNTRRRTDRRKNCFTAASILDNPTD